MIDTGNDTLTSGQIDQAVGNPHFFGNRRQRIFFVGVQNDIGGQQRLQYRPDMFLIGLRQHKVGRVSCSVPTDQYRNLFFRQAALAGFAAPFARCPTQALPSPFLRFKEVGFIGFGNARQTGRMLAVGQTREAMAPAESGVGMNAQRSGTFADARSFNQLFGVMNPFRFVPKSGQGRVGQCIEGDLAGVAAIPLQPVGESPARHLFVCAMRTDWLLGNPGFNHLVRRRRLRRRLHAIHQNLPLVRRQFLERTRQLSEITGLHLNTYRIDPDGFVIDQHSAITYPILMLRLEVVVLKRL